jgi:hypothetical protein
MPKLADVARDMERATARGGTVVRTLNRGLEMRLTLQDGVKTLVLSRPVVAPSNKEVAICRAVFGVPADAVRAYTETEVTLQWPT